MPKTTKPKAPDALCFMGTPYISIKVVKQVIRGSSNRAIKDFGRVYVEERQKALDRGDDIDIRQSDAALKAYTKTIKDVVGAIIRTFDNMKEES